MNRPLNRRVYGSIPHLPGSKAGPGDHYIPEGKIRIASQKPGDKLGEEHPQQWPCVWDVGSDSAPCPSQGVVYLVEIWQNVNGYKVVWHEIMQWNGENWCLNSSPCIKLGPTQIAHRWIEIASIYQGWIRPKNRNDPA
ncbi:MAG: hypothetical protein AAF810_17705 [Cyanobacteria bacterium P01_D01_bin.36]